MVLSNAPKVIRILFVDDHPVVRAGLAAIIGTQEDMLVVGQAGDAATAINLFRQHRPDITLMDLHLPGASGIEATKAIRGEYPDARIIVLTTYASDEYVRSAIEAGARAYLLKESLRIELLQAIRSVYGGARYVPKEIALRLANCVSHQSMTPRELEVLSLMTEGFRNRDIAIRLSIAEETVKVHVKSILGKLDASDRTQAIITALRRGLTKLD